MKIIASKSALRGTVLIPASKSHTIRAIAIASLANGHSTIKNPLISGDTLSAVACYRSLGADIDTSSPDTWSITGTGGKITPSSEPIDVGNSGTTLRIAIGSAALADKGLTTNFTGDQQIRSRSVAPLLAAINQLGGVAISSNNGCAPVSISGPLKGGKIALECVTSQYLSSLLLAAPLANGDTEIEVTLLNEPDYVQITLDWLKKQHIEFENDDFRYFKIPGNQQYNSFDATIPADFSSATFFLCAGAILDADITIAGLDFTDSQPDKAVFGYLKAMGADISIAAGAVRVTSSQLKGIEIDMNATPDALPAMAVCATFAQGTTKLVNVAQARGKETDRIRCMAEELKKIGADIEELPDGLIIKGSKLSAGNLNGRSDHRIVMALSLAAMAIDEKSAIETAEAVNVTFPEYVSLMQDLGANMKMIE